jgi:hypothetical protein
MRVRRVPSEASAIERARWLADLAQALGDAQMLAWELGIARGDSEAMELYGRIETAVAEVQSLRRGGRMTSPQEHDPKWTDVVPWATGRDGH